MREKRNIKLDISLTHSGYFLKIYSDTRIGEKNNYLVKDSTYIRIQNLHSNKILISYFH